MVSGEGNSAGDEVSAIISFLCNRYPETFQKGSPDSVKTTSREAIILASVATDAFYLRRDEGSKEVEAYPVRLERGLASPWAKDTENEYAELFEDTKKIVKFFPDPRPMAGYSGRGAEAKMVRRTRELLKALELEVKKMRAELADVLFVPHSSYTKGRQLSERIYHYFAGLVFRDMGYLVLDEYAPIFVTATARTPDLLAFRTPELIDIMNVLRAEGVISRGAFLQELQLYSIFGRQNPGAPSQELTDGEGVVVEVKRSESEYLVRKGSLQLREYMSEAHGLYDEGYLSSPFIVGPGTVSLDGKGELVFERATPSTSTALTDYWKEKRALQLQDVRNNLVLEVLKSAGLSEMIDSCGGKEDVRTYGELVHALGKLDIQDALKFVR